MRCPIGAEQGFRAPGFHRRRLINAAGPLDWNFRDCRFYDIDVESSGSIFVQGKGFLRLRIVIVSFATDQYTQAARLLTKSGRRYGIDESRVYGPGHPIIARLAHEHPNIMSSRRGAGYWLWKPYIILDVLDSVPDGTLVLYTDSATTFVADPAPFLAIAESSPVSLFQMVGRQQSHWTKRDCFVDLEADSEEFWNLPQLTAGYQLYRAGDRAKEFVSALSTAMANERRISDTPNVLGRPNLPGFVDHRHDQSILTIVAKKMDAAIFPDPSQFGPWDDESLDLPFKQTFHLHRLCNRRPLKFFKNRVRGIYTGGRGFI